MTPLDRIDIDLLLAFDALLSEKNVTRAARQLQIRQPALSARLARLREIFADRLFIPAPNGRGVLPTPHALTLQPLLTTVLASLDTMLRTSATFDPQTSRRVFTLAVHENPAVMLAPDLVRGIAATAPAVRLVLTTPDKPQLDGLLESGKIDLYIGIDGDAHDTWMSRHLFTDDFLVGQRKGHPRGQIALSLDSYCAADHLLVSSHGAPFHGLVDEALIAIGRQRRVALSIATYALAPTIIASSDLLCTLPSRFLQRYGTLLDLFAPPLALKPARVIAFWHPRQQEDAGNIWLREQVFLAASSLKNQGDRRP